MADKVELPEISRDPNETKDLCKCRPICKSRRRAWKGTVQKTSAELLLERKNVPDCFKKWPAIVYPNEPCPLLKRTKTITYKEKYAKQVPPVVVRICPAPIDDTVHTPYLHAAGIAKRVGALDMVQACCPFCMCGKCCLCGVREYPVRDDEKDDCRRAEMRKFDSRVKDINLLVRVMYD